MINPIFCNFLPGAGALFKAPRDCAVFLSSTLDKSEYNWALLFTEPDIAFNFFNLRLSESSIPGTYFVKIR